MNLDGVRVLVVEDDPPIRHFCGCSHSIFALAAVLNKEKENTENEHSK